VPTQEELLAQIRRMVNEPTEVNYSDAALLALFAQNTNTQGWLSLNGVALSIWNEKLARYAELTDISESGSERKLSQLYKNAANQVKLYLSYVQKEQDLAASAASGARVVGRSSAVWSSENGAERVLYGSLGPRA
jgi:hypothetical protein